MSPSDRSPLALSTVRSAIRLLMRPFTWLRRVEPVVDDTERLRQKLRVQVQVIQTAFDGQVAMAGGDGLEPTDDPADVAYLYRPGTALVPMAQLEQVEAYFESNQDQFNGSPGRTDQPVPGLVRMTFPERVDGRDPVLATLSEMEGEGGGDERRPPIATPDHLLYVTYGRPGLCPATEPELPGSDRPVPTFAADRSAGAGIRVSVVDTGLWEPATLNPQTPWLHQDVVANPQDQEVINPKAIHEYGGHGTFVAGVIKQAAPAAYIQVEGALTHGGAVYESELVEQLHEAYREQEDPQLISISAGTHTRRDFALVSFDALKDALGLEGSETLVIAAAGNDGSSKPFWPAAFPWVVGVGAVDGNGKVSDYSNYGPWVDVYALGTNQVNAFPIGTYTCYEPPNVGQVRTFTGMARWSGTSFATPVVTGLVAAEKSRSSKDVRSAAGSVIKGGAQGSDPAGAAITIVGPLS